MSECELQTAYSYSYKKTFNYKKSETTRYNAFIDSQFNHAPVTWMFCQKTHPKIEKIHDKTLKIILQSNASYRSLLECNGSTSVHQWHLHFFINGNLQKCCNHWPPDSCGTYSEKRRFHIMWERVHCFSFSFLLVYNARDKLCTLSWHTNLESATKFNKIQ